MPYLIICNTCGAHATLDGEQMRDPDAFLDCKPDGPCCLKDHHHGVQAGSCDQAHEGDCDVANPDCAVCRSITIEPLQGTITVAGVG